MKIPLAGIVVLSFLTASCSSSSDLQIADKESEELRVRKGSLQKSLLLSGTMRYELGVDINSPNGGWRLPIRWIIEEGAIVKKGDKVLEMDTGELVKELDNVDQNVSNAMQALLQAKQDGRINIAEKEHSLRLMQSALSRAEIDANMPEENSPKRQYQEWQRALARSKSDLLGAKKSLVAEKRVTAETIKEKKIAVGKQERARDTLKKKLDTFIMFAPRDGLVVVLEKRGEGRPYQVDDNTWPGQTILKFPDFESAIVEAELSDVDDGQVFKGMAVTCILDAYPNTKIPGHVSEVSPVANPPSNDSLRRIFRVEISIDENHPDKFHSGSSVQILAHGPARDEALLVPRAAINFHADTLSAELADGGNAAIEIGDCSPSQCVLVAGLEEGTRLRKSRTR